LREWRGLDATCARGCSTVGACEGGEEGREVVPGRRRMRPIQSPNSLVLGVVAERKIRFTCGGSMIITC